MYGAVVIIAPAAGLWILRAGVAVMAVLLLRYLLSVRRLIDAGVRPSSSGGGAFDSMIGILVGLAVLGLWAWCIARAFVAGNRIDAALATVFVCELAYLEWLKSRSRR